MSADKRDFTDFEAFPGSIQVSGIYEFPKLIYIDKLGNDRQWQIFIRLVKDGNRQQKINWNLLIEDQVPIKDGYLKSGESVVSIPSGIIVQLWKESGVVDGKITRTIPTYFTKGVLQGRANERNALQQALIQARSEYIKKYDNSSNKKKLKLNSNNKNENNHNVLHFPMLAKPWADGSKHLVYPAYVQPKLDGVRCLVYLKKKNGTIDDVIVYTRTQKMFPNKDYLKEILHPFLKKLYDDENDQSIFLDGELYRHGERLQDISGKSRNVDSDVAKNLNQYFIYDCFYPLELDTPFSERLDQLLLLFEHLKKTPAKKYKSIIKPVKPSELIKITPTFGVKNVAEGKALFKKFIDDKYEGAIFRNASAEYMAHPTNATLRSVNLVKMKNRFSDEFEVVGYKEGTKGKDKGAILWVCKTPKGDTFNVTPKDMTYEERYKMFIDADKNFDKKYKNRMLTVEYEDLSKKNIPLRAKGTTFRDYE